MSPRHPVACPVPGAWLAGVLVATLPANQIVRIPVQDLADAGRHGAQPLVSTGRTDVPEQESRLRFVDGEPPLGPACVVADPRIHSPHALAPFSDRTGAPSP